MMTGAAAETVNPRSRISAMQNEVQRHQHGHRLHRRPSRRSGRSMPSAKQRDCLLGQKQHQQGEEAAAGMKSPRQQHSSGQRAVVQKAEGGQSQRQPARIRRAQPHPRAELRPAPPGTLVSFCSTPARQDSSRKTPFGIISGDSAPRNWPRRFAPERHSTMTAARRFSRFEIACHSCTYRPLCGLSFGCS